MEHEAQLKRYLFNLKSAVFKLLPMKEEQEQGADNHLQEYLETVVAEVKGATETYPWLGEQRYFLTVINNICYLERNSVEFWLWRKLILDSMRNIDDLYTILGGVDNGY